MLIYNKFLGELLQSFFLIVLSHNFTGDRGIVFPRGIFIFKYLLLVCVNVFVDITAVPRTARKSIGPGYYLEAIIFRFMLFIIQNHFKINILKYISLS